MNWNHWIRKSHRSLSVAFTVTVIANFLVRARGEPPPWVTYSPLIPLFLLLFSGLYMFVLPYAVRSSGRGRESGEATRGEARQMKKNPTFGGGRHAS